MKDISRDPRRDGALLSAALKKIRRLRGMTVAEAAQAMNIAKRSYERFEAGEGRFNLDHVHRFARATRSDAASILFAVAIGSPELAVRCADNKLGAILMIVVQRLDRQLGERLSSVDPRTLIRAATLLLDALAAEDPANEEARRWLHEGLSDLQAARPKPGR